MKVATKYVEEKADIIDINMGCPAPKVVKNGDGSKLLLNIELAENIAREVVKVAEKPVTVKLRKGWDNNNIVYEELAKRLERMRSLSNYSTSVELEKNIFQENAT